MATSKTDLLYYLEIENLVLAYLGKGGNNYFNLCLIKKVSSCTSHKKTPPLRLSLRKLINFFLTHSFMNRF